MSEKSEHSVSRTAAGLPGQQVLPDLVALFGYDSTELKTEHEIFVTKLLELGNATEAYLVAYPDVSRSVARRAASRLLTNDDIRRRFAQAKQQVITKVGYDAEAAYRDLVSIITYDKRQLYDENGKLLPVHKLDQAAAAMIEGIEETRLGADLIKTKLHLPKRLDAIDKVLRYHGAYKDKLEMTGKDGGAIVTKVVREIVEPA